jgi:release factor glutamine methyltransferase
VSSPRALPESTASERVSADEEAWSIGRVVRWAAEDFARKGFSSPRLDAELLLGHVLGLDRIRLIVDANRPLAERELTAYRELIKRRRRGEPIAYIRGEREFYGLPFRVDSRVLVPRPDTETLVETALRRTKPRSLYGRALDLCTGSGCVAIAFARSRPTWRVTGSDLSSDALAVARENRERLGSVHNTSFTEGDLFAPLAPAACFELITGNPPYIPRAEIAELAPDVRDFEPRLALDGGDDGLDLVRRIIEEAPSHLAPGAVLALEIGYGQAAAVTALFEQRGFRDVARDKDYGGVERVVSGVYGPP